MKRYAPYALSVLLSFTAMTVFSQNNSKPKQFNNFPATINCSEVFNATAGQVISLSFSDNFSFSGSVKSNIVKYANMQTAVVVSPAFSNTIFSVSKITMNDGTINYLGRIINKSYFDGFELKKNASGNYQLVKMETDRLMPDCKQL
jgi:hypothetical protein